MVGTCVGLILQPTVATTVQTDPSCPILSIPPSISLSPVSISLLVYCLFSLSLSSLIPSSLSLPPALQVTSPVYNTAHHTSLSKKPHPNRRVHCSPFPFLPRSLLSLFLSPPSLNPSTSHHLLAPNHPPSNPLNVPCSPGCETSRLPLPSSIDFVPSSSPTPTTILPFPVYTIMPAPKRTRATATADDHNDNDDVDNNHRSDDATAPVEPSPSPAATTPRVTRRSPVRRALSAPSRSTLNNPASTPTPSRPTLRSTRATPTSSSPSPGITRSHSLFGTSRGTNGAIIPAPPSFAGPSTRSSGGDASTLVRAASMSAVPNLTQIKESVTSGGNAPPPVKGGGAGDDTSGGGARRPYKGKENVPPPKESPLPTPPSEASRKRVRMTPSSSRTRSTSVVSVRSESESCEESSD